jgi:anti-anti-sigma factor
MFSSTENENSITLRFSASMVLVDRAISSLYAFVAGLDKECDLSGISTVARELLVNAVEHGNCNNEQLDVTLLAERISDGRYRVSVRDQGNGVDPQLIRNIKPLDNSTVRSRGLAIANVYADELVSEPSEKSVSAYITLKRDVLFTKTDDKSFITLAPQGDLTASIAERFRKELLGWYDSDSNHLILDMVRAGDIDSVCLSVLVSLCNMPDVLNKKRKITIVNAQTDLINLVILTRLNRLIEIREPSQSDSDRNRE